MNILLVGAGGMGNCHYLNYGHIPGAKVVALVGKSESDRQNAEAWQLPIFDCIADACAAVSVDLVDVCAPTFLHKQLVLEAIAQGKHVITEKPIALSLADGQEMYAAAEAAGVQLYVAQVLQFTREVETLRQVVRDGRYGKPLDAHFVRLTACPKWSQGGWLLDKSKSGLLPFDLHIHDLDVIVSMFGKPDSISYTQCNNAEKNYAEHYRINYGYESGLNVCAEASWFNACIPFTAQWRVYFERGMLINNADGLTGYSADGEVTRFDVEDPVKVPCGINLPDSGWFLRELGHLLDCAAKNVPSEFVPKEQILSVLEILEKF